MPAYEAYGTNYNAYDQTRKRNQSYFPNTGAGNMGFPQAPGVAEGQARMDQIAKTSTYKSRQADFRSKYPQFVQPQIQPAYNSFMRTEDILKGQGGPIVQPRQPQGGLGFLAGNLARSAANQFSLDKGAQRLGQLGTFAANLFGGQGRSQDTQYGQNVSTGQMPNAALQAVENFQQSGSFFQQPGPTKPFKYFYD